jgi:hypothetical protein
VKPISVRVKDISEEFTKRQNELLKVIMPFMAEFGIYGLAVTTNGRGDYESTIEFDKIKVAKWKLEGHYT